MYVNKNKETEIKESSIEKDRPKKNNKIIKESIKNNPMYYIFGDAIINSKKKI